MVLQQQQLQLRQVPAFASNIADTVFSAAAQLLLASGSSSCNLARPSWSAAEAAAAAASSGSSAAPTAQNGQAHA
jgi:hypothetical protein